MNSEENQGFTSFDFITIMVSFAVIAAVTAPIIKKNIQSDQRIEMAKQETNQLSRTLVDPSKLTQLVAGDKNSPGRMVASVGTGAAGATFDLESMKEHLKKGEWEGNLGKDPWGQPYHFSFIHNSKGQTTHVAVWSDGPNKTNETSVQKLVDKAVRPEAIEFSGDDLGSIIPLR